ncbi:hypothetical protein BKA69DRAFT_1040971 [Paraphysoderma sedebokerense]|nr:hypothetical protein BKA69DRAFT_1040971 [Paraphysoderma sedebokerense]
MSNPKNLIQVEFKWPYSPDARKVIVTGSFDNWSQSIQMKKDNDGVFTYKTDMMGGQKVDNNWFFDVHQPNEPDSNNNINNICVLPVPQSTTLSSPSDSHSSSTTPQTHHRSSTAPNFKTFPSASLLARSNTVPAKPSGLTYNSSSTVSFSDDCQPKLSVGNSNPHLGRFQGR